MVSRRAVLVAAALLMAALLMPGSARAAEVEAELDRQAVAPGEAVNLEVVVRGARNPRDPEWPELPGWDVQLTSAVPQVTWINGRVSSSVTYTFAVTPPGPGKHTIPALTVALPGGGALTTEPLTVTVRAGGVTDLFLESFLDPPSPFVGELAVHVLRLGYAVPVDSAERLPPDMGGFLAEVGIEPQMVDGELERDDVVYKVREWRTPVFALQPGAYSIGPAAMRLELPDPSARRADPFFGFRMGSGTKSRRLKADGFEVTVRPLPEEGRPPGFMGPVGRLQVTGNLDRTQVSAGDSVGLDVRITGRANLRDLQLPRPSAPDLRVFAEDPIVETQAGPGGFLQTASFEAALVPMRPGTMRIPALPFQWFDPAEERYKTASLGPWTLNVQPGNAAGLGSAALTGKRTVEVLGEDILPIRWAPGMIRKGAPTSAAALKLVLLLLPPLLLGGAFLQRRRLDRMADPAWVARKNAGPNAKRALTKAASTAPGPEQAGLLRRALADYLGAVSGTAAAALPDPALLRLIPDDAARAEAEALLTEWSACRYGGAPGRDWTARAEKLIARLREVHG